MIKIVLKEFIYVDELKRDFLVGQLKSAYLKFKNYSYYDNYSALNRCKIAEFEVKNKINNNDNYFQNLAKILLDENKREELFEEQIDGLDVICYPKSMNNGTDINFLGNIPINSNTVDKVHYFLNIDIVSHILGVLWIIRDGWVLDDRLYKNCHGNRINKDVINRIKENKNYNDLTPFLFEPYFKKYQTWRDEAINSVEKLLEQKDNAIMFSLDFKNYYYSSTIDFIAQQLISKK